MLLFLIKLFLNLIISRYLDKLHFNKSIANNQVIKRQLKEEKKIPIRRGTYQLK